MNNPVIRFFKPKISVRLVDLAVSPGTMPVQSAKCEVVEYDSPTGMQQWNDSVFMRDFEDFILEAPAPLTLTARDESQRQFSPDRIAIRDILCLRTLESLKILRNP
jgi:hypothetical protein